MVFTPSWRMTITLMFYSVFSLAGGIASLLAVLHASSRQQMGAPLTVFLVLSVPMAFAVSVACAACCAYRVVIDYDGVYHATIWSRTRHLEWREITKAEVWGVPRLFGRSRTLTMWGSDRSLMLHLNGIRHGERLLSEIAARAGLVQVQNEKSWGYECQVWQRPPAPEQTAESART